MSGADMVALLPLILLAGSAVIVMLGVAIRRHHALTAYLTAAGLAASFGSLWKSATVAPRQVTPLLLIDHFALFYIGVIIATTFVVVALGYGYFEVQQGEREEFYILLLIAATGSAVLVASDHFASFFLGLEILSVSLYAMIAFLHTRRLPVEAGIKYLVLAAASSAFLLFGMALVYLQLGTMSLPDMIAEAMNPANTSNGILAVGVVLIVTGIGFKLGVVPFHLWTPDVYEGSPAPVTTFVATVSKGAMFALLLRYFHAARPLNLQPLLLVFAIIAVASMCIGNLLALLQGNVKRILAYSSVAQLGYVLVAMLAGGTMGTSAATFYLVAYFVTSLGAFGIVTVLSTRDRDAGELEDYRGLFWRRPVIAAIFTMTLLSLAGIPLTAGFVGKFYIVAAGASSAIWYLVLTLVITSVIGLFYYLRIISAMFAADSREPEGIAEPLPRLSLPGGSALVVLSAVLIWLGVYPQPLVAVIRSVLASLQ